MEAHDMGHGPFAELAAFTQALSASVAETRTLTAELIRATARCLATAEQGLAELREANGRDA